MMRACRYSVRSRKNTSSPAKPSSWRCWVSNPHAGLLFVIPGVTDTFRVNGRARLTTDPALLEPSTVEGKRPALGILIDIDAAYMQCSKASVERMGPDALRGAQRAADQR
jgi:uncharacterized protein